VDNPDGRLRPGMYAQVTLTGLAYEGLAVPASAIFRMGDQSYVFKVVGPRQFTPIEVQVGTEMAGWVPVHAGLDEGDEVVISGVADLKGHFQYQGGE
jgi:cobalt-zinc-cadmium efflux system membrane fusion protein